MPEPTATEQRVMLRRAHRIPLDIVAAATGQRTEGLIVAVLASELDAYEERIWHLNNLAAGVAGNWEDEQRLGRSLDEERSSIAADAAGLWDNTWLAVQEIDQADEANERAAGGDG